MARALHLTLMLAAVVAIASGLAACGSSPTSPSSAPFSFTDITTGDGAEATTGLNATIDYTGWLWDPSKPDGKGLQFTSSIGGNPFIFTVGQGQAIAGWDRGVPGMRVGGTRRLVIPPSLAYGATRNGAVPANATLVFDVTLLDVTQPSQ